MIEFIFKYSYPNENNLLKMNKLLSENNITARIYYIGFQVNPEAHVYNIIFKNCEDATLIRLMFDE